MKLIIAGSRTLYPHYRFIANTLDMFGLTSFDEIISGGASGVDGAGEVFASEMDINLKIFQADWNEHGKAAGPIRNKQMVEYADALLLIWDGTSRGSKNMKETMLKFNKPVYEVILREAVLSES